MQASTFRLDICRQQRRCLRSWRSQGAALPRNTNSHTTNKYWEINIPCYSVWRGERRATWWKGQMEWDKTALTNIDKIVLPVTDSIAYAHVSPEVRPLKAGHTMIANRRNPCQVQNSGERTMFMQQNVNKSYNQEIRFQLQAGRLHSLQEHWVEAV